MDPKIIFEDKFILVVDKPAGWVVNESKTTGENPVIQTWLKENFKYEIVNGLEERSGIVHRLDKQTSGILIIAKTQASFNNLQDQFKERVVEKYYTALAHGKVEPKEGIINVPVGRLPWNRERFGILPGGRESVTNYKVQDYYQSALSAKIREYYSLLNLNPKTGRTHQIRIHLKYLGHPIVADEFYAGRKTSRRDKIWFPRLFLHAAKITFDHPQERGRVTFESDLPEDLSGALDLIEKVSAS